MDFSQLPAPPGDPWYVFRVAVDVLEAFGVVGAIVVALWDKIAAAIWKPRLSLRFEREANPLREELVEDEGAAGTSRAVRHVADLELCNQAAHPGVNCRLLVTRFERFSVDGRPLPHDRRFKVRADVWDLTGGGHPTVLREVSPRFRFLEVSPRARIGQAAQGVGSTSSAAMSGATADVAMPFLVEATTGDTFRIEPGKYVIELLVIADGGHRAQMAIEITHKGVWNDRVAKMVQDDLISVARASGIGLSERRTS